MSPLLAPDRREAGSRRVGSRVGGPSRGKEAALSPELPTPSLPKAPVQVGDCWQNNRSCHDSVLRMTLTPATSCRTRTAEFSSRRPCRGRCPQQRRGTWYGGAPVCCNGWFSLAVGVPNSGFATVYVGRPVDQLGPAPPCAHTDQPVPPCQANYAPAGRNLGTNCRLPLPRFLRPW